MFSWDLFLYQMKESKCFLDKVFLLNYHFLINKTALINVRQSGISNLEKYLDRCKLGTFVALTKG